MENTKQPENINRVIETLKKTALFHGLDEDVIKQLSSQVVTRQFPKNSIVVTQGDETDSLYVILKARSMYSCKMIKEKK